MNRVLTCPYPSGLVLKSPPWEAAPVFLRVCLMCPHPACLAVWPGQVGSCYQSSWQSPAKAPHAADSQPTPVGKVDTDTKTMRA